MSLILPMENKENTVTWRNSHQTALFSHHRNWRFLLFTTSSWITEEHSATAGRNPKMQLEIWGKPGISAKLSLCLLLIHHECPM